MARSPRTHLVTGATGFIGAALVLELLSSDPDCLVVCLVRESKHAGAGERLRSALTTAARLYGSTTSAADLRLRARAVVGDVTRPRCGVSTGEVGPVDELWHCAASLDYRETHSDEIMRQNLTGTEHVLELLQAVGGPTLNHFSTAYVAGSRTGEIAEEPALDRGVANNAYERSKIAAEQLVAQAGVTVRIMRPSIVIGHSVTCATTGFSGVYGFIEDLARLKAEVSMRLGDFLKHRAIRSRAHADAELNLVPVDVVARTAVALGAASAPGAVYHLTNATPPTIDDIVRVVCQELGVRPFELGASPQEFTTIDEQFDSDQRMAFFRSYITVQRSFDQSNVRRVLGAPACADPLQKRWREYVRWYLHSRDTTRDHRGARKYRIFPTSS
ncbi:SDR family oxidoreductase [Streptosporangium sp. NPDC051023]|uniref:SDR family oxidoreductase n=1 Tax=Streptosporangium sp. NPDC051023 TaxID=3155410 RepID=UPI00344BF62D